MLQKIDNPLDRCDLKFSGMGTGQFEGYASVFGGNDSYNDTILKGAFADTISERASQVRMFYGHNPNMVIGKWLDIREDDKGLIVKGEFTPGHTDAANVYASMKHGAISGLSIGFRIPAGGAEEKESGGRLISKINLVEISAVAMPADADAQVSSVKMDTITSLKDAEFFLRDSGMFTRSMATAFVSQLKTLCQSDSDAELLEQITELKSRVSGYEAGTRLERVLNKYSIEKLVS